MWGMAAAVSEADNKTPAKFRTELVELKSLKPHPRNYRKHPADQLEHIKQSLREHGFYRNVVVAKDSTILAGHGVVQACGEEGILKVPVIRLPIEPDSPQALKVLTGDNEISHLGEIDDRLFTELLKEIKELDTAGLLGTGYDDMMLANLVFVTRAETEIPGFDAAAEWAGMPGDTSGDVPLKLVISFRTQEDRERFVKESSLQIDKREAQTWMTRWPWTERQDWAAIKLEKASA